MTKTIKLWGVLSLMLLLSLGLVSLPARVRAEDTGKNDTEAVLNNATDSKITTVSKTEAEEAEGENNDEHEEGNVNKDLHDLGDIESELKLDKVNYGELKTYKDAIDTLTGFKTELAKIKSNGVVADQISSSLTDSEKALLTKLLNKHQSNFDILNARITDLESQINELVGLLTPLADQAISPQLKGLIYVELKDLRSEIKSIANLEFLNIETLNQETL